MGNFLITVIDFFQLFRPRMVIIVIDKDFILLLKNYLDRIFKKKS